MIPLGSVIEPACGEIVTVGDGAPVAFSWLDVLIVAAWGVGGLLIAVRYFTWEPRKG